MSRLEQFLRFAMIGAVATALQYVILFMLVETAFTGVVAASSIGFALSALANYALNRRITFHSSKPHAEALPKFASVATFGLALNACLVWIFHTAAGVHYLLAQVLATCGTLLWTFTLNRFWTFSSSSPQQHHRKMP